MIYLAPLYIIPSMPYYGISSPQFVSRICIIPLRLLASLEDCKGRSWIHTGWHIQHFEHLGLTVEAITSLNNLKIA